MHHITAARENYGITLWKQAEITIQFCIVGFIKHSFCKLEFPPLNDRSVTTTGFAVNWEASIWSVGRCDKARCLIGQLSLTATTNIQSELQVRSSISSVGPVVRNGRI